MSDLKEMISSYKRNLVSQVELLDEKLVSEICEQVLRCWKDGRRLFICGNGGSAANAVHLANDYLYGVGNGEIPGMKVTGLPANEAVMTCLANDVGYEFVFSQQLRALASEGDILLAFSGSGNSPNIVEALKTARELGLTSIALLGFSGGKSKDLADVVLHIEINDMQISEDLQLTVGHMIMKHLFNNRNVVKG